MGRLESLTLFGEHLGEEEKEGRMEIKMFLGLTIGLMAMSAVLGFRDNGPQQKWSPYKPRFRDDNDYNGRISRLAESSSGYYPSWQVAELGTMYKRGGGRRRCAWAPGSSCKVFSCCFGLTCADTAEGKVCLSNSEGEDYNFNLQP